MVVAAPPTSASSERTPAGRHYAPFGPETPRRFDHTWLWGGSEDDKRYQSEQILATCRFRTYRSIGGDHSNLGRRLFASRAAMYVMLQAIGQLPLS
ncbi:hypothetical protein [Streptomyces sp. C10]|uniref:hypothetical protein n=1 Tax=Streptomyces sp. C10 TaxID=531941 RepID=UPI0039800E88